MNRIRRNDFSYKILQPYVHGSLTRDTTKYFFQDARYGTYHANVDFFSCDIRFERALKDC